MAFVYIHKVSHELQKVANKFGADFVFSRHGKLAKLCKKINQVDVAPLSNKHHITKCSPVHL